jgi:hypothetical protein
MSRGSSEQVRIVASENYVQPAIRAGKTRFSVAVKDLKQDLVSLGFPSGNTPQICTALQAKSFLRENGLEIESVEGPPSKLSTTVVVHYRVRKVVGHSGQSGDRTEQPAEPVFETSKSETPEARALRLTEQIRGLLKDVYAEYGGGEAFLRWVRGYDEEDAE